MANILTDLSSQPVLSFPKPEKKVKEKKRGSSLRSRTNKPKKAKNPAKRVEHNRGKAKQKDRTAITPRVAEEVHRRADGACEICGRRPLGTLDDRLELAHLIQRGQQGSGRIPWNIAALCGPSTQSGTCHWKIDSRRKTYRHLVEDLIAELESRYDKTEWPDAA